MRLTRSIAAVAFAAIAATSPIGNTHSLHEKRSDIPPGWERLDALDRRAVLPVKIGLAQSNLDKGWEWLNDVSHPSSPNYSKHWTPEQVARAFAPSDESLEAVRSWLSSSGIASDRLTQSRSRSWLEFEASVGEAEELLKTKYHVYEHGQSGQLHVASEEYSVPSHLKEHIDIITPTVHFDVKVKPRKSNPELTGRDESSDVRKGLGWPGSGSLPKGGRRLGPNGPLHGKKLREELAMCDEYITPDCLRALYQFPINHKLNKDNSYGIVEYTPQAYVPGDLDLFFANFSKHQVGDRPILDSVDGGVVQQDSMGFEYNGESDLDLEYAMALVYPQPVTLYQVGDIVEGASFNNFLDAIDGSYCTYEGGDDPSQDAIYPDPYTNYTGAYEGAENCGGYAATKVISTSYSYNEHDLTPFYAERQCHEYMKLGMMGVTVLYSSGDYGVAGNSGQCIDGPGLDAPYNAGSSGRFNPSFPGTCPYVTAVGATQVKADVNIAEGVSGTQPEKACETVIYSGGGFSNVFPLPDYQADAVHEWFDNYPPPYGADRFNNSQQTRGLPDISANLTSAPPNEQGANYVVAVDGAFSQVYGTSASSPTLGSILTLINQARLHKKKNSIGFINPVAYAHPEVFNDVVEGGNQGCGTPGFQSAPGWDPVTGLGTPNYPKMLDLWMGLD
ncbi:hypothetical protein D0865_09799 [Hortaea werneckii]|uniref:tripeptidyl-peptidase II n=1 Tax=Hortaea werneckii TaxID=91943 RepID=A0A3M7C1S0_HORWE|nr:hypothetical protein D0865_09799 [Hortaea werneckii]